MSGQRLCTKCGNFHGRRGQCRPSDPRLDPAPPLAPHCWCCLRIEPWDGAFVKVTWPGGIAPGVLKCAVCPVPPPPPVPFEVKPPPRISRREAGMNADGVIIGFSIFK